MTRLSPGSPLENKACGGRAGRGRDVRSPGQTSPARRSTFMFLLFRPPSSKNSSPVQEIPCCAVGHYVLLKRLTTPVSAPGEFLKQWCATPTVTAIVFVAPEPVSAGKLFIVCRSRPQTVPGVVVWRWHLCEGWTVAALTAEVVTVEDKGQSAAGAAIKVIR